MGIDVVLSRDHVHVHDRVLVPDPDLVHDLGRVHDLLTNVEENFFDTWSSCHAMSPELVDFDKTMIDVVDDHFDSVTLFFDFRDDVDCDYEMYDNDDDLIESEMNFENHCLNMMSKTTNETLIDDDCSIDDFVASDVVLCKIRLWRVAPMLPIEVVLLFDDER